MKSPPCPVGVPSGPSYRAAVCPWPPSPWESAVSDRLLTGTSHSWSTSGSGSSSSSTGLSLGGIQLHCTASISYRSDIFISSHSPEEKTRMNLNKKETGWTPCRCWMIPFPRGGSEGSSVSRKRELELTCSVFPGRSICAVSLSKTEQYSSKAACQSSSHLIKARAPPPPPISFSYKAVVLRQHPH